MNQNITLYCSDAIIQSKIIITFRWVIKNNSVWEFYYVYCDKLILYCDKQTFIAEN